jgi:O-antigen ligase
MFYFYLANRLQGGADIRFLLAVLAVSLFTQALIVIALWVVSGGVTNASFSIGPVQMMIFDDGRPCGTLFSPVLAGSFLAMLILPSTALAMVTTDRARRRLCYGIVLVGIVGMGLTQTRGAILGLFLGGTVFVTQLLRWDMLPLRKVVWCVFVLTVIGAWPAWQLVQRRVIAGDEGSAASRIHLAKMAGQSIAERPILGVGAGNCHLAMLQVAGQSPYRSEWFYTVHNKYLLVWTETGLVGLTLLLSFVVDTLRRSWLAVKFGDRMVGLAALALGASVIGHLFHMALDVFNSRPQVQFLWTCAGIVAAAHRIAAGGPASVTATRIPRVLGWAGGFDAR